MSSFFHEYDVTHNGRVYHVGYEYDGLSGPPQEDCDGFGVVFKLSSNDEKNRDFSDINEAYYALGIDPDDPESMQQMDDPEIMEEFHRLSMLRIIGGNWRWGYIYYDVWETIKKAKRESWGCITEQSPVEDIMAVVESDYKYISDWYADKWHYIIVVVSIGELESSLGGVEYGYCLENNEHYLSETVTQIVDELERSIIDSQTTV